MKPIFDKEKYECILVWSTDENNNNNNLFPTQLTTADIEKY